MQPSKTSKESEHKTDRRANIPPAKPSTRPEGSTHAVPAKTMDRASDQKEKRTGGVTQPTLSQLARMKASEQDKQAALAKLKPVRPLTIRPKAKSSAAVQSKGKSELARRKEEDHAAEVPLPDSPVDNLQPALIPLPASPHAKAVRAQEDLPVMVLDEASPADTQTPSEKPDFEQDAQMATPVRDSMLAAHNLSLATKTPISALVSSIERGFIFTPGAPLSPPQSYVSADTGPWAFGGWTTSVAGHDEETSLDPKAGEKVPEGADTERRVLVDMN
ncbi:hypothetical protein FA95DRAFT_77484 [Auriscalpium vulgare]|uniref:Uncharacterized protein n=1 Tax=Auriscalpium vulgare TaxID=40419 RepID=A0ACB8RPB0_9AGAM|nr:hypothetical protein FA95DRAFT_77484 [Auriscalpium vulgare]